MERRPEKPWFWKAQDVWAVQWRGKRIRLAKGKRGKAEAFEKFHRMMAEAGRETDATPESPPVGLLVALYLENLSRRRESGEIAPQTKADVVRRLSGFAEACGDLPADQIKPKHVTAWLDTRTNWNATSRHDGVGAVKAVFAWAESEGHIDRHPFPKMGKPRRKARREEIPDAEGVARAFAAALTPELADLLHFLHATGCRPKEARTLEARHIDFGAGVAVLSEHKTAKKTGKRRPIYLAGAALEIAKRLAESHPSGPIFLNSKGNPWTKDALGLAVRRLRKRAGLGKEMVAYALRHVFTTDAVAQGTSVAILAELLGHADLRMLSTYSHVSERHEALKEAAAQIQGQGPVKSSGPACTGPASPAPPETAEGPGLVSPETPPKPGEPSS